MTAPRPQLPPRLFAGAALVLIGLVSWALYSVAAGSENHSFRPNGAPPASVRLVEGHTYWIAIPGGVARLRASGVDPAHLSCTAAPPGQAPAALKVSPVVSAGSDDTKFINRIGSFVAGRSGSVHVECQGIGVVYIDNAADSGFDWSGLWLVLAALALVVGLPLILSGLRRPTSGRTGRSDLGGVDPAAERPLEFEGDGETDVVVPGGGDDLHAEGEPGRREP